MAVVKRLTIKGSGFEIWQGRQELSIDDNCELLQPDQSLSAKTCNWNWDTGEVVAQGDVELRRQQYNQVTRAQELRGVTGEEGEINFTAPGQQVQTQLDVGGSGPSSPTQQGRPSAPPVAF